MSTPRWLWDVPVAHRGWHDEHVDENSPTAFERAAAAGLAIELDVQLGEDEVLVLHDANTLRTCGVDLAVGRVTEEDRALLRMVKTSDPVLSLKESLQLIGGRVPVIVEIKDPGTRMGRHEIVNRVARKVERYADQGHPVAVHSFDTSVLRLLAKRAPQLVRGQVAGDVELRPMQRATRETYVSAPLTQPLFIAHNVERLPSMRVTNLRNYGLPVLAWVVRSAADLELAAQYVDNVLVEGEALELVLAAGGFKELRRSPPRMLEKMAGVLHPRDPSGRRSR